MNMNRIEHHQHQHQHLEQSSAPLKKRAKMIRTESRSSTDEEAAVAGLAALSSKQPVTSPAIPVVATSAELSSSSSSSSYGSAEEENSSDSEASFCTLDKPKPVHEPPKNSMMVDHTYTDYSVVREKLLSHLDNSSDDEDDANELTDKEKATRERALRKVKKIFGDIGPTRRNPGGVVKPFPEKLMQVLDRGDMDEIITWLPHGRAFIVVQSQQLKTVVLPRFFKQTKFMSFTRQLNLWGFKRITKGHDAGAYYHELFLRGRPRLSTLMRRQKIKGTGIKLTPNPDTEPNFYKISETRPLPVIARRKSPEPLPPINRAVTKPAKVNRSPSPGRRISGASVSSDIDYLRSMNRSRPCQVDTSYMSHLAREQQHHNMMASPQQRLSASSISSMQSLLPSMTQRPSLTLQDQRIALQLHQQAVEQQQQQQPSGPASHLLSQLNGVSNANSVDHQHHKISSALQLLTQVNGLNMPNPNNSVESLKQQLLNAAQSLDQQYPSDIHGRANPTLPPVGSSNAFQHAALFGQMQPQHHFPQQSAHSLLQQHHQQQQSSQGDGAGIAALMSALDQTRQVAAAAQAQSSLLQQVATDLAFAGVNNNNRR